MNGAFAASPPSSEVKAINQSSVMQNKAYIPIYEAGIMIVSRYLPPIFKAAKNQRETLVNRNFFVEGGQRKGLGWRTGPSKTLLHLFDQRKKQFLNSGGRLWKKSNFLVRHNNYTYTYYQEIYECK